jgi:flagellar protein FlbD
MIRLTRLNRVQLVVNLSSIQYIESTPDTLIVFNNGDRVHVVESVEDIVTRARDWQRMIHEKTLAVIDPGHGET